MLDKETRDERLRQLRRVVVDAPDDGFDMTDWSTHTGCGTAHCAGGWAALDPWHQENTEILLVFVVRKYYGEVVVRPVGAIYRVVADLAELYGIEHGESECLFGIDCPDDVPRPTRDEVIANIDALLRGETIGLPVPRGESSC